MRHIGRFLCQMMILSCFLFSSCTIKEDRSGCPVYIVTKFLSLDSIPGNMSVTIWVWDENWNCVARQTYDAYVFLERGIDISVDKNKNYRVTCLCGFDESCIDNSSLSFPSEVLISSLWGFSASLYVGESEFGYFIEDRLYRQFAELNVTITEPDEEFPYDFKFRSNTSGFSLYNLNPFLGEYAYQLTESGPYKWHGRVSRQWDFSSLQLDIVRKPGTKAENEQKVLTLPLGRDLIASGYDPWAADMSDINIEVSFSEVSLCLKINDWEVVYDDIFTI